MNPPLRATLEYLLEPPPGEFRIDGWATFYAGLPVDEDTRRSDRRTKPHDETAFAAPAGGLRRATAPTSVRGPFSHRPPIPPTSLSPAGACASFKGAPREVKQKKSALRRGCLDFSLHIDGTPMISTPERWSGFRCDCPGRNRGRGCRLENPAPTPKATEPGREAAGANGPGIPPLNTARSTGSHRCRTNSPISPHIQTIPALAGAEGRVRFEKSLDAW